ncbi:MAG: hypothetical protein IIU39_05530 [Ruminococcus sp.]|nr:hypothetical protein [Ruminococcus sp.]
MNYNEWAEEYFNDAKKVMKTIKKYEKRIESGEETNEENINSIIAFYRYVYYDILNTAKMLKNRAEAINNA